MSPLKLESTSTAKQPERRIVHSQILGRVSAGNDLSMDEMAAAVDGIMQGEWSDEQIALLLTALRAKGESVDEVAGAAAAMRKSMTRIQTARTGLLDTCGTGGDGSGTFNISTAAALVVAAAGVPVAKHGNRGITSRSGSADVLRELGVNVEASIETVSRCLDEVGICFCFAPLMHPSMKRVAQVRRDLGVPTIFNLLGPLCNPAEAPFQLLGVGRPELRPLLAGALSRLGTQRAVVVCGDDGLDEVTICANTQATIVENGSLSEITWNPAELGVEVADRSALLADGPAASAAVIQDILGGATGPPRDIVVANAAAGLWTVGRHDKLAACTEEAARAIDSGAAKSLLKRLVQVSGS